MSQSSSPPRDTDQEFLPSLVDPDRTLPPHPVTEYQINSHITDLGGTVHKTTRRSACPKTRARSPAVKLGRETLNPELCHSVQRRFAGAKITLHTAKWVAQQIQEDEVPKAIGILSAWTHLDKRVKASEATIAQLNSLSDEEVVLTLHELRNRRRFIQRSGGNKLTMRVILTTTDNSKQIKTPAHLNCGCTSSTIHKRFVQENNLPTKKLPLPVPFTMLTEH